MENLCEQVFDHYFLKGTSQETTLRRLGELRRIQEYFGDQIGLILNEFLEDESESRDFILENLQTHDIEDLIRKLRTNFGEYIRDIVRVGPEYIDLRLTIKSFEVAEEINHLIEFYGYKVVQRLGTSWQIEPVYPKRQILSGGNSYHVVRYPEPDKYRTFQAIINSIETKGLRPRNNNSIRKYPNRVYIFNYDLPGKEAFKQLQQDAKELGVTDKHWRNKQVAVYKVQMNRNREVWYHDPAMSDSAYFTYSTVGPDRLKRIF